MSKLARHRAEISALILRVKRKPFEWGTHDCCVGWACPVIKIQTGIDLAEPFFGKYTTAMGAYKALLDAGFKSPSEVIAQHFQSIPIASAQFGDVVALTTQETGEALAVIVGERIGILKPSGYGTLERCHAKIAFRIE